MLSGCANAPVRHASVRQKAILSQAAQGDFPVVILGDSFVELADVPTLCGQRVLNAGVSGATVADVAEFAPKVLAEHPSLVVVEVGINDAHQDKMTPDSEFRASYETLIAAIRKTGAKVHLMGVPVVGDARFDKSRQEALRAIERRYGARDLPALSTDDGVHPNAAGYVAWKRVANAACPATPQTN